MGGPSPVVEDDKEAKTETQQAIDGGKDGAEEGERKHHQQRVSAHPPKTFFQLIESQVHQISRQTLIYLLF